jgi:hypothetical protein
LVSSSLFDFLDLLVFSDCISAPMSASLARPFPAHQIQLCVSSDFLPREGLVSLQFFRFAIPIEHAQSRAANLPAGALLPNLSQHQSYSLLVLSSS